MEFEKMNSNLSSDVNVKQLYNQRQTDKSYPCGNNLSGPEYINFVSPNRNLARYCIDTAGNGASGSLGIFCRTASLLNVPLNLSPAEFFFQSLKGRRRTKSINDLGEFIVEYSAAASSGNVIINPSGKWLFDTIEGAVMARAFLKSSVNFQLGTLESDASHVRSRSLITRHINFSELTNYPSGFCHSSPHQHKPELMPFGKRRSKMNLSEEMLVSCSGTSSTCSHQSTSSAHCFVSKGMLYCVWKSGIPYFVFSVDNDQGEVYVASPQKIESSIDKAVDYLYLFHSRADGKKYCKSQENSTLGFSGKMKVSSSLVLNPNTSRYMETEFVLFGAHDDHSREMQGSTSTHAKSKGLSKKVADLFRSSHSFKHNSTQKISQSSSQFEDFFKEFVGELNAIDEPGLMNNLAHDCPPNLELAAIVVKDYQHYDNREVAVGGWGLKFLDKVEVCHTVTSQEFSFASKSCEESYMNNRRATARSMNVLIPAGFHGGPVTRVGGPSSLTERWRSGGHCDCGGWDISCPLTVLNNNFVPSEVSPQVGSQEDCKPVNLFIEGANHGEPILRMVNMNEGLYFIYFQSTLSALQSFSIGVAIIHTQTPELYPKL